MSIDYDLFSNLRYICHSKAAKCYKSYLEKVESNVLTDSKQFWNFINSNRKENGYPSEMFLGSEVAHDVVDTARLFSEFFKSVYDIPGDKSKFDQKIVTDYCVLNNTFDSSNWDNNILDKEFINALNEIKFSLSSGPDGIPSYFIKNCSHSLIIPLVTIFNKSLHEGSLPEMWKCAHVISIYKSGDRSNITNYRPIAILNCIPILDKIMHYKLFTLVSKVISPKQHGFYPGRNILSNLFLFTNKIYSCFSGKSQLDTFYLDFRKAFDLVDHQILLLKLKCLDLPISLLSWLTCYILDRKFCVYLKGLVSPWYCALSGVPQGSNLGPLLFLIFINDITFVPKQSNIILYADDAKIYMEVKSAADCIIF